MIVIGIDPGISGAIAAYSSIEGLLETADLPITAAPGKGTRTRNQLDPYRLHDLLVAWSRRHRFASDYVLGVIERMQAVRPGNAAGQAAPTTLLSMGHTAGIAEGVLAGHARQILRPIASQWKRGYGLSRDKSASVDEVIRRFQLRLRHDRAEAVLLALWGSGQVNGATLLDEPGDDPFADPAPTHRTEATHGAIRP